MSGNLFIVSSPSGGGKGTLIKYALERVDGVTVSVSFTTRSMREGEENGREYHFVGEDEFRGLIEKDEFLEYAEVHGNLYGTSRSATSELLDSGVDVILEIDVQGACQVREKVEDSIAIFIVPPSYHVLRERLIARGTEAPEDLEVRLRNARAEMEQFDAFDFAVVNDELEQAGEDLLSVITTQRLATDRQNQQIRDILSTFDG